MSRRTARVAEAIRQAVSQGILFELKDPRVTGVTVTKVEVPADLRSAKVFVSLMGSESEQKRTYHGLTSARGFLQRKIGDRLDLRYTPVLSFVIDDSVKKSLEISRLLTEVMPTEEAEPADPDTNEADADDLQPEGSSVAADDRVDTNGGEPNV